MKVVLVAGIKLKKIFETNEPVLLDRAFNTREIEIYPSTNLNDLTEMEMIPRMMSGWEDEQTTGSGWSLVALLYLISQISLFKPLLIVHGSIFLLV